MSDTNSWKFPKVFWIANSVELLERAAFYGMFISISIYLSDVVGFDDIWAGIIGAFFSAGVYLLPTFVGAWSDKMGFRRAMILAFTLQCIAYFTLGALPFKSTVVPAFFLLMVGGAFIKSLITGTVAKSSNETTRARAYSIFYGIVNIGAFSGKTIAFPVRLELGIVAINYYSAAMTFCALIIVYLLYRNIDSEGLGKSFKEIWHGLLRVLSNARLITLILIVSGFWLIQHQMYASMPKYVLRTVGQHAAPEWIANVNPAVVMMMVILITSMMKHYKAITSMIIGMLLMPLSGLLMSAGPLLGMYTGIDVSFFGLLSFHPITIMLIAGIAIQGLAECFISPRYLEFFSNQSPKGEEGLYLGFAHLHSFFANFAGFFISGFLLDAYCPDPKKPELQGLSTEQLSLLYENAHFIWYYFAVIGFAAAVSLLAYKYITDAIDRKKANLRIGP